MCQNHFEHYPIWKLSFPPEVVVSSYRTEFWNGNYSAFPASAIESTHIDSEIEDRVPMGFDHGFTSNMLLSQTTETCRQIFGYNSHEEIIAWTSVHWPNLKEEPIETSEISHSLTDFQEACMTRMFMRTNINITMLAALWWTNRSRCSRAIAKWVKRWEYHSKILCRLKIDKEFLMKSQVDGMEHRYGVPISHLVDGTVIQIAHPTKAIRSNTK